MTDENTTPKLNETNRHPLTRRLLGVAVGLTFVAAIGVGCSSSGDSTSGASDNTTVAAEGGGGGDSGGCTVVKDDAIEVVTTNFDYQPDCITTSGDRLKITYDNKEEGVKHNIDFKELKSSSGAAKTELKSGPNVQTLTLVDLKPGTYEYICDIHANMKGKLIVK